jgi:hypothetical protein
MDSDAFDEELLNPSPLRDTELWPSSPRTGIATQLGNEQPSDDSLDDGSGDDDGLYDDTSPGGLGDDYSEGSFGDGEQVVVAADQYSWKIDHSKGDHKFKCVSACGRLRAYTSGDSD